MTEKKLYLILNESIYGVGGSFVYIMNKLNYYKRKGFEVCCIHGGHDMFPIIVPKLKIFKDNREPAVRIPVFYFSKTQRKKIANTIIKKYHLDKYDEVIIESSTYNQATWGEYISYLIGAKHFVLLLAEKPVIVDINAFNFLKFKYERMELCGIVQKSLQFLFDDKLVIPTEKSYYLPCYCNNSIDDVSFHYDEAEDVLHHVSFEIKPGETFAFVGPSGGGKSTIASLAARFFDAQSGNIRIGGVNIRNIPKEELMNTISVVFQNARLIHGSILENVRLGRPQASEQQVYEALETAGCMDIIDKFPDGIHTMVGGKGVNLSGGEKQRIAIARAVLKNAPILILDEATAFADPDNESKIQASLAALAKDKTVLMIAHRLSTVKNADCICVLENGTITEQGTFEELNNKHGVFAQMWEAYRSSVQWNVVSGKRARK